MSSVFIKEFMSNYVKNYLAKLLIIKYFSHLKQKSVFEIT